MICKSILGFFTLRDCSINQKYLGKLLLGLFIFKGSRICFRCRFIGINKTKKTFSTIPLLNPIPTIYHMTQPSWNRVKHRFPKCIYNSHYGNGVPALFTSLCPAER